MALIDLPFFPVATPRAFYELQLASASKTPDAMQNFSALHPEFAAFRTWLSTAPWTASYAEERYNSIDSFVFTNSSGVRSIVRWSLLPSATATTVTPESLAKRDADFLESDIMRRVHDGPVTWRMVVFVAGARDPVTDPSKIWTDGQIVEVGELVVQSVEPEADGPCREINYDPTVLPPGMGTSGDPFPAARASAYRRSYDLRTSEARFYPRSPDDSR
jgi:catalase